MIRIFEIAPCLPDEYYPAIGEVLFRWAQLEYQMQEIIWRALDIDNKKGRTLTVGMSARTLIGILGTLRLKWLKGADARSVNIIAKKARDIIDTRNQFAHGSWRFPKGGDPNDVWLHYMKEKNERLMPNAKKLKPKDIRKTTTALKRVNKQAQGLIARIEAKQKSSPQKSS